MQGFLESVQFLSFRCPVLLEFTGIWIGPGGQREFPLLSIFQSFPLSLSFLTSRFGVWGLHKMMAESVISPSLSWQSRTARVSLFSPLRRTAAATAHTHTSNPTHTPLTSVFRREGVGRLSCLVSAKLFFLQVSSRLEGFLRNVRSLQRSLEAKFCEILDPYAGRQLGIWHLSGISILAGIPNMQYFPKKGEHLGSVEDLGRTGLLDRDGASASFLRL